MSMLKTPYTRAYMPILKHTLERQDVMLFVMGARQVGKTTLSQLLCAGYPEHIYLNWDIDTHREKILEGQGFIESIFPSNRLGPKPLVIFDELHKYKNWKNFIKGFWDAYGKDYHIVVTGSAHLNVFQKGGDSLMGRYIPYTIYPFSLGELNPSPPKPLHKEPFCVSDEDWDALRTFGGFPVPFVQRNLEIYNQWKRTRQSQMFREDVREMTHIHEVAQLEQFGHLLSFQAGNIFKRSSYAQKLGVTIQTINRWLETLKLFYYAFAIYPWKTNIPHSLVKEPKVYLCDWSLVSDPGQRFENMVAVHLKKSIDFWNESGQGDYALFFLRDKQRREVDFLVTQNQQPWILVEAKTSVQPLSSSLRYFAEHTQAPIRLQVTQNMDYLHADCFTLSDTTIVPARTFLSQLF